MTDRREVPEGTLVFPALVPPGGGETELALHRTTGGELVAVGFTSLDALIAAFGPGQRWLAFAADAAPAALEGSGVTRLLVDPVVDWSGAEVRGSGPTGAVVTPAPAPPTGLGWSPDMKLRRARDDDPARVTNPEVVSALLAAYDAGADGGDPADFDGARFLAPIGPGGLAVVVTSLRTIPLFTDMEAFEAWMAPCVGFVPDADFEPRVNDVQIVEADGLGQLARPVKSPSFTVNPAGPGWSWYTDPTVKIPGVASPVPTTGGGDPGRPRASGARDDRVDPKRRKAVRSDIGGALRKAAEAERNTRDSEAIVAGGRARRLAQQFGDAVSVLTVLVHGARINLARQEWLDASGLGIMGYAAAGTHAKPRLEYEGYQIMAAFDRQALVGDAEMQETARDTAQSRTTNLRLLADVAMEQGSMSLDRRDRLYEEAAAIAASWL